MPSSIHVVDGTTFTERRLSERESEADTTSIFSSEADEEGSNANNNEERSTAGRLSLWQNELYAPPKIFHAVWNHQWDYARFLLSKHNATSSLAHTDSYGYTPLHFACWEGAPASLLNEMLSKYAVAASRRNNKGRTPLHFACWRGTDECVNRLLKHRPDAASVRDNNGKSPLYDACARNRSYDVLRALILADIQQSQVRSRWGYTPAAVLARTTHACTIVSHAALQTLQRCDGKKSQEKGEKEEEEEESDEDKEEKEYRICDIVSRISLLLHAELHNSFPLPPPPQLPSTKKNSSMMPPLSIDTALRSKSCPYALLLVALEYDRKSGQPLSQLEIPNNHGSGGDGGDYLLHTAAKLTRDDFPYDLFYRCDKCGFIPPREEERREEGKKFMYFNKDPYMSCYGVSCSRCVMEGLKMHYLEVEPGENICVSFCGCYWYMNSHHFYCFLAHPRLTEGNEWKYNRESSVTTWSQLSTIQLPLIQINVCVIT